MSCQAAASQGPSSPPGASRDNSRGTAIKVLVYDGQGFWLCHKRLSEGRFRWWPTGAEASRSLRAHQAQLLLAGGDPETEAAPIWRRVSV